MEKDIEFVRKFLSQCTTHSLRIVMHILYITIVVDKCMYVRASAYLTHNSYENVLHDDIYIQLKKIFRECYLQWQDSQ